MNIEVIKTADDDFLDLVDTDLMSFITGKKPLLCPTAIAVHDEGNVPDRHKVMALLFHLDGFDVVDLLGDEFVDFGDMLIGFLLDFIQKIVLHIFA